MFLQTPTQVINTTTEKHVFSLWEILFSGGLLGNIIWFLLAGVWLAIGHMLSAAACFVTIIGIPFAIQHVKLALIALAPIGKTIVDKQLAAAMNGEQAQDALAKLRNRS